MSETIARKLVCYRSWFVAAANAGITWVILIIAPLGLFAVILCTAAIFASSLLLGRISDFALFSLLHEGNSHLANPRRVPSSNPHPPFNRVESPSIEEHRHPFNF
jgi:hypothetical protein